MKNTFYITTPIYYPSGKLTLGNSYTTIICDAIARFNRMQGKDVFYLTGTDEHGQKISDKAKQAGKSEIDFLDEIISDTKQLWKLLDISYDKFIRTTDEDHVLAIQKIFTKLYNKGEIYKSHYTGLYCTPCESFWTEEQLIDGKCPDCGRPVIEASEEAYFFRLSNYADRILKLYENPEFLQPQKRVNEMVNNFIKPGLKDLCVSRTSVKWGIPVEFDTKHTIYVWIDALFNYATALGYLGNDDKNFKKFWPADIHIVGKEIVRFHAIIWPAFLMAMELPLPKTIYAHGWILFGGDKLSKSKTTETKQVIDPRILISRYGVDAVRLYLLKEIPFGSDGNYSQELFLNAYNNYLSNDLGNLVSRTLGMVEKYQNKELYTPKSYSDQDNEFMATILSKRDECFVNMASYKVTDAITNVFEIFQRTNKYISDTQPWVLAKDETKSEMLNTVLSIVCESILIGSTLLLPFLPEKPTKIFEQFGCDIPSNFDNLKFGILGNTKIEKTENLYPRLVMEKEIKELNEIANA